MSDNNPHIQITVDKLISRGEEVRKMLTPIAKHSDGPAWGVSGRSTTEYVIGTHGGSPPASGYRDWYFPTILNDFRAQYFERWLKHEYQKREFWYLERAYLNIYRIVNRITQEQREYICLHCDPQCSPDEIMKEEKPDLYEKLNKQAKYKKLPHLHIVVSEQPVPHAHLALNVGQSDHVLSSVENLSIAISQGIQMLKDEIFDAI